VENTTYEMKKNSTVLLNLDSRCSGQQDGKLSTHFITY